MLTISFSIFAASDDADRGCNPPSIVSNYPVADLNSDLREGIPTFDVVVDHLVGSTVTWSELQIEIRRAKEMYLGVGVQLRVLDARQVCVPHDWLRAVIVDKRDEKNLPQDLQDHMGLLLGLKKYD